MIGYGNFNMRIIFKFYIFFIYRQPNYVHVSIIFKS
jgi:hypothetical protein